MAKSMAPPYRTPNPVARQCRHRYPSSALLINVTKLYLACGLISGTSAYVQIHAFDFLFAPEPVGAPTDNNRHRKTRTDVHFPRATSSPPSLPTSMAQNSVTSASEITTTISTLTLTSTAVASSTTRASTDKTTSTVVVPPARPLSSLRPSTVTDRGFATTYLWSTIYVTTSLGLTSNNPATSATLFTNAPTGNSNSFAGNRGAVIGVVLGSALALFIMGLWIFFAFRTQRRRGLARRDDSSQAIMDFSPHPSHGTGDDGTENFHQSRDGIRHSDDMDGDRVVGLGEGYDERHASEVVEVGDGALGRRSVASGGLDPGPETANDVVDDLPPNPPPTRPHEPSETEIEYAPPRSSVSYQPSPSPHLDPNYMPSYPPPPEHDFHVRGPSSPSRLNSATTYGSGMTSFDRAAHSQRPLSVGDWYPAPQLRANEFPHAEIRRPSSFQSPPSSYKPYEKRASTGSHYSLKSFLSRFRGGGKTSPSGGSTTQDQRPSSEAESTRVPLWLNSGVPLAYSPSSAPSPSTRPPSATADSLRDRIMRMHAGLGLPPPLSDVPWNAPTTLPPSPAGTDGSRDLIDGLLDPQLIRRLAEGGQPSLTSLADHEDYTRRIRAVVKNEVRHSTATLSLEGTASDHPSDHAHPHTAS